MSENNKAWPSVSGNTRVLRIPGGKAKQKLNIGTWNVRSLYEAGKLANTILEMNRLKVDILGISETWWPDNGEFASQNTKIFYSGNLNKNHRNGVGVILKKNIAKCVTGFFPKSDRTMLLKLKTKPINLNIIQIYAPTADKSTEEIEAFYTEIEDLIKMTKPHELTIIQGDFNAKVGSNKVPGVTGQYGLGERNERGDRLIQFCQEHKMKITNTLFSLPARRRYTWISPQDRKENIVRNQIDYIIINTRYSSSITKTSTYPGADVNSDHNLLVTNLRTKLSATKKIKSRTKINTKLLQDSNIVSNMSEEINRQLNNVNRGFSENIWNAVKNTLRSITEKNLTQRENLKKNEWITDEILQLIEERRKYKNVNYERYWELNREIRTAIRIAKNEHLKKQCLEIEILQNLHDDLNLHKKLKETSGIYRKTIPKVLYNNHEVIFDIDEKKLIWKEYIKQVFTDSNRSIFESPSQQLTGNPITKQEVESAVKALKDKKACGPDEIPAEVLKLIDDDNIELLTELFNYIYNTAKYPLDWLKSTFITIPKKNYPKYCCDYRLISLMSHALKIFLRIIHSRIYEKCEKSMGMNQFGFKEGMGTREALFSIQTLIQKCRNAQKDIFLCFIDYEKAFDNVKHDKLMEILESIGIDQKEIQCIKSLYWHQTAQIEVDGQLTEAIAISKGVRQGCILSPLLFNIYSEKIFEESIGAVRKGILVNGIFLNNIRYADDTTLLADSLPVLQDLVNKLATHSTTYGLNINISKTKYMIVSKKNSYNATTLKIKDISIERVQNFKYLGVTINDKWDCSNEIRCRIEIARNSFLKYKKILTSHDIHLETKSRFIKTYIWSVLLYAVETWTIKSCDVQKLEAFEMWIYRRVLKIPWTDHVSNDEVLRRMQCRRELFNVIKKRKISYLGHIMRNPKYKLLQSITRANIEGKAVRGRKETTWTNNIQEWTGIRDIGRLLSEARDRNAFAEVLRNSI